MGYRGCMAYGMHFPANQLGGPKKVWSIREYGLSGLWVKRESTVLLVLLHICINVMQSLHFTLVYCPIEWKYP